MGTTYKNGKFDKDEYARLVNLAKGPNRSINQFANDVGVPYTTISRILKKENSTASSDRILVAIAENAAPGSLVTIDMLRKANGINKEGPDYIRMGKEFEERAAEIIIDEFNKIGFTSDDMTVVRSNEINSKCRYDMSIETEKFGKWVFEFKATTTMLNSSATYGVLYTMREILENGEADKCTIVVPNDRAFRSFKHYMDKMDTLKSISVMLLDLTTNTIDQEYGTGREYRVWSGFKDDKISLIDILKKRYQNAYDTLDDESLQSEAVRNYCKDRRNELTDLLKRLGVGESIDLLRDGGRGSFVFYRSEVPFINELLDERSKKLVPIRRGEHFNLQDEYAVHLYENIYGMFLKRCGGDKERAYKASFGAYNVLDIPIHEKGISIRNMQKQFEDITRMIFEERMRNITSRKDDLTWINFVADDIKRSYERYVRLYDLMYELRQCEINDKAEQEYKNMSKEDLDRLEEEEFLSISVYQSYINNEEVRELYQEESNITGRPVPWEVNIHNSDQGKKREELSLQEIKNVERIEEKLRKLYEEEREKTLKDALAGALVDSQFEKDFIYPETEYMTSEDLLKKAMEEYKEENSN